MVETRCQTERAFPFYDTRTKISTTASTATATVLGITAIGPFPLTPPLLAKHQNTSRKRICPLVLNSHPKISNQHGSCPRSCCLHFKRAPSRKGSTEFSHSHPMGDLLSASLPP